LSVSPSRRRRAIVSGFSDGDWTRQEQNYAVSGNLAGGEEPLNIDHRSDLGLRPGVIRDNCDSYLDFGLTDAL